VFVGIDAMVFIQIILTLCLYRNKETKLEETLKIREKSLTEQRKSRIEMETYCNKLEAKNTELEFMLKTLQRSIE
jgi:septal ring factor EnvC (AmiA/AmiB activator)